MYLRRHILFLFSLLIASCVDVKGYNTGSHDNYDRDIKENSMSRDRGDRNTGLMIDIDDNPKGAYLEGSGTGPDDTDYSGDGYDQEEGSADFANCHSLRQKVQVGMVGAFEPQCDSNGDFKPRQCHGSTGWCWCVDRYGDEIDGTKMPPSNPPDCSKHGYTRGRKPNIIDREQENVDFFEPTGREKEPTYIKNSINNMPDTDNGNVEIQTVDPILNQVEMMESKANVYDEKSYVMMQPGVLAAIIGGAVVGLLCAVLLVMFIVYRMRKKDEGSYALDEPKRSPPTHQYARASTKEFYA